jgi:hypothetical protein
MVMLVPAVLGLAVAAGPSREFPSEAEAATLSGNAECVARMEALAVAAPPG